MSTPVPFAASSLDPLVHQYAGQFGLDPNFLKSVIYQESRFDPNATSPVGARGLMQIMPDTARQPGFGMQGIDPAQLGDPETNVAHGAQYLRKMIDRYGGDTAKALVAYNWGAGNADEWLAKGGKFSELPKETQGYITNIRNLYAQAQAGEAPERTMRDVAGTVAGSAQKRLRELQAEASSTSRISQLRQERAAQGESLPASTGMDRVKDELEWAGKAIASGALDTAGLLAMIADGPLELTTPLVQKLDSVAQDLRESVPEWMKASLHKRIFTQTEDGGIEFDWPSLRQVANLTLESLSPGGVIVGGGRAALRGLSKVRKLDKLIEKYPKMAAAASLGAANSTYIAADTYREVYDRVLGQAQDEGMSLKEAHDEASRSATLGAAMAGAIAFPTGALGEGLAASGSSLWARLAKGTTLGAITEAPEESGQYLAEQIGSDQPVKLVEFLERGALGAFGAGPVEGILAAVTGKNPPDTNLPAPPTEEIAQGLQEGQEAVQRQTEVLAQQSAQRELEQKPEAPVVQEEPTVPEPQVEAPAAKKGESFVLRTLKERKAQHTLSDGSTQRRLMPQADPQFVEQNGIPIVEGVVSKDETGLDMQVRYSVFPEEKRIQIQGVSTLEEQQRGKGKGIEVYENIVNDWLAQGYEVHSDASVSRDAANVYEALSRRGYTVTQNPSRIADDGNWELEGTRQEVLNSSEGVFVVSAAPAGPREQGKLSLPPGSGASPQLPLGTSELSPLVEPQAEPKVTPVNRKGRFMPQPGPVEAEPEVEPNPAQQDLPLPTQEETLEQGQKEKVRKAKKGGQIPLELPSVRNPVAVVDEQFEQRRRATAHAARKYRGTRLLDPVRHEYNTQKEAKNAPKPPGSQVVKIGDKYYVAAPVVTGEVYTEQEQTRPAELSPEEQEMLDAIEGTARALDAPTSVEKLQEDYTWAREAWSRARDMAPYVRYRLDGLGNQIMERWRETQEEPLRPTASRPPSTSSPEPTAATPPETAPAASLPAQRGPVAPVPNETQAQTGVSAPAPTPEPEPLTDENSTAVDQVPPSDEVARNPHVPPEMRDTADRAKAQTEKEFADEVERQLAEVEEAAPDAEDSVPPQQSARGRRANRSALKEQQRQFEALQLALAKSTNVTWQGLWYKIKNPTSARAERYVETHKDLMNQSVPTLLKRLGKTYLTILRMYLQDSFLPVRQVQEVLQESGVNIDDHINFYQSHEAMHSKVDEHWRQRNHNQFDPLAERMRKLGVTQKEFDRYLWYTHAPHRNAYIKRKREEAEVADPEAGNPNPAGISDAEAKTRRRELIQGREEAFRELDTMIREITQSLRDTYRSYGLIPEELLNEWDGDPNFNLAFDTNMEVHKPPGMTQEQWDSEMFHKTYVPLAQLMEGTKPYETLISNLFGEHERHPAVDVFGDEVKAAYGRDTPPNAITAHIKMMTHSAIIRGERNEALLPLYNMAKENPNEYLWEVEEGDTTYSIERDPLTGLRTVLEEGPRTRSASANVRAGLGVEGIVPGDRGDQESKGTFRLKKDGKVLTVHTYWTPLTKAIRNSERLPRSLAGMKAAAGFSRWIAVANTTLSPGFAVSNLIRDYMTAKINLTEKNGLHELNKHVTMKNWKHAMKAYWAELNFNEMPDEQVNPEAYKWRKMAQRYMAAGAHTAFFQMRTSLDHYNELERLSREASKNGTPTKIGNMLRAVYNVMNTGNTTIENAVRLIAFSAAVDPKVGTKQHTDAQAASIAKNLTVNFQKRGHASIWLGALYVFFNATMQGNMRIIGAFRRSPKVRGITYAIAAGGFANAIMQELLGGDDDEGRSWYSKVPEHVRERNLVLMIPGAQGRYVSIPLPYGFNAFWVTGDSLGSSIFSDNTAAGPAEHDLLMRPLTSFYNTFNPIGSTTLVRSLTPTFAEPFHDIMMNTNFFGSQINPTKSDFSLTPPPDAYNVLDPDTQKIAQAVAQTLGKITGGSPVTPGKVDVSPGTLRYLFEYLGGSGLAGSTLARTMDAIPMLFTDPEAAARRAPVIRRLYGMTPEFNNRERFYQLREFLANVEEERDYLRSIRREEPELLQEFMQENQVFWSTRMMARMETANRAILRLTKKRNKIRAMANKTDGQKAMMARYDAQIDRLINQFNSAYFNAIVRKAGP